MKRLLLELRSVPVLGHSNVRMQARSGRFHRAENVGACCARGRASSVVAFAAILAVSLGMVGALVCSNSLAQDTKVKMTQEQITGPANASEFSNWLADITQWRLEKLAQMNYRGAEYDRPELQWTQRSFIQPQMMVEDRYFYDPVAGKYTVDRFLDDLEKRYGGIDSVLVWAVYRNIGIDNRNQHDMVRALPGGLAGVRQMVADFHRRGVKVLFPVMPWDVGTRDEGAPLWEAIARSLAEVGADGINGDTITGISREFRTASDQTGHALALEPENGLNNETELPWNNLTWGYWNYSFIPTVSKYKWLEPRHLVNICRRWGRDKTDDLQHAFFNGTGYESWENVWGIWNGITPRDAEALRRLARIARAFPDLLISSGWEPHTPTLQFGSFASKFPGQLASLWTFVNRNEYDLAGRQIRVAYPTGSRFFDLWHGVELKPEPVGDAAILSFEMEAKGFGAVLATTATAPDAALQSLLSQMKKRSQKRLADFSHEWRFLPQQQVKILPTRPAKTTPSGMIKIPAGDFDFQVSGIEIESGNDIGVDVQYPWEDSPRRHHRKTLSLTAFYIDRYPVTNEEFKKFLAATNYRPRDPYNFLKDWSNGSYPEGWAKQPVTWVSLEDARAYAAWAGKRLPHEWEWQYAAQGTDNRLYPWGNEWKAEVVPIPDKGRQMRAPTNVEAYPQGASPFGVMDLVGNVWQWTDEYVDDHTRAAIVRGGSYYQAQGSHWYFPQAYRLTEHGKLLLMAPSKDRAGTLGFRCVVDAQ
jgi:iron(II)-dependent oxidoreductase